MHTQLTRTHFGLQLQKSARYLYKFAIHGFLEGSCIIFHIHICIYLHFFALFAFVCMQDAVFQFFVALCRCDEMRQKMRQYQKTRCNILDQSE